jgi:hypothetical protein
MVRASARGISGGQFSEGHHAAEMVYSITSSARASRFGGMARFSVLAAQRLSPKSNLI